MPETGRAWGIHGKVLVSMYAEVAARRDTRKTYTIHTAHTMYTHAHTDKGEGKTQHR